ncbi:ficolin-1-like [Saccostrea cucullata]|uniref:ficolin-1-like n=1 Tax=Saccostrea cuccullata TaxID=36930 RepID=UPI002ED09E07
MKGNTIKWRSFNLESEGNKRPLNCKTLLTDGHTLSNVYTIYPRDNQWSVYVQCDMTTKGGGWTVIQRRVDGSTDFDRTWQEYKEGFGSVNSSYWLGNDVIHLLTKNSSSLYVSITLNNGTTLYQQYEEFYITDETDKYRLYLNGPTTGTLGDGMLDTGDSTKDLSGMYFTTLDRDNDRASGNCAGWGGGWWFNFCHNAFLNGPWYPGHWIDPWSPTVRDVGLIKSLQGFKLHNFSNVPEQQSCTSIPQQWHVPRGSKIKPIPINHLVVARPTESRKRKPVTCQIDLDQEYVKS